MTCYEGIGSGGERVRRIALPIRNMSARRRGCVCVYTHIHIYICIERVYVSQLAL